MGLSKSLYVTGSQCMKALWLKINKPEEEEISDALESRFDVGHEIGALARQLFTPFTLIEATKPDGRPDIDEMIRKTALVSIQSAKLLLHSRETTVQSTFCVDTKTLGTSSKSSRLQ